MALCCCTLPIHAANIVNQRLAFRRAHAMARNAGVQRVLKYDESVKGRDSHAQRSFGKLGIEDATVQAFYDYFNVIDFKREDKVDLDEFLDFFELPKNYFTKRVFKLLDDDFEGSLDFEEFLVGLWNYSSADPLHLIAFAFMLYDVKGEGTIDKKQFSSFVKDVYDGKASRDTVESLWRRFDTDRNGVIELSEFASACSKRKNLLFPAFAIQTKIRQKLFGLYWWNEETKRRMRTKGLAKSHIHEILMHEEERFGSRKAQELGKHDADLVRERELKEAENLAHGQSSRRRSDSHSCEADVVSKQIAKEIEARDFERQREIYRNKHGFSPSKYVHLKRKKFKKRRKEHHKRRKKSLGIVTLNGVLNENLKK